MLPDFWRSPPPELVLDAGTVHLWRLKLDLPEAGWNALIPLLSADERQRADRFYFEHDRRRYIASKGAQRSILAGYLQADPHQLQFEFNPYGKPSLRGEHGDVGLRFNLSHSRSVGLLAVARGAELGVDLEFIRDRIVDGKIARRYFSPVEVAALEALPAPVQIRAFFACWTRKEAYIKARGEGLSFPLDQFSVSLVPDEPAVLLANEIDPQETRRWHLYQPAVGADYEAALAIGARDWRFKQWAWPAAGAA